MFTIEKDLSGIFWHIYNNARTRVNVSDFDVVIDSVSQTFIIQCKNGSNIPSQAIAISLMQVIDLSVGTSPIPFSGAEGLIQLLITKNYTPYLQSGNNPVESVYVYRVGQVGVFTMTPTQFTDNFDGTGLGRNTMLGWALRNGSNGTKNQQGKFSLNKGASPYDVIGAIGGSPNAVLIGHKHKIAKATAFFDSLNGSAPVSFGTNFTIDSESTGLSENGVSVPDQTGVGKNMPPYLIDVWVERVSDLVITTGSGGGGGGGVQTVTGVNVTGTPTDRVVGVPTLQQVTGEDNETTNDIIVKDSESKISLQPKNINFQDIDDGGNTILSFDNTSLSDQVVSIRGQSGTMAFTSDIPTLVAGTNITIDDADPLNPIISASGGGGGGSQTLAQTLALGNSTGGENILVNNADAIELENGSFIAKGSVDESTGGVGGIEQTCSVGYKWKWEAGEIFIRNQSGQITRKENARLEPTVNDDITKNFIVDAFWEMFDGTLYICTFNTEGAAVWDLYNVGSTPTLGQILEQEDRVVKELSDNIPYSFVQEDAFKTIYNSVSPELTLNDSDNSFQPYSEIIVKNTYPCTLNFDSGTIVLLLGVAVINTFELVPSDNFTLKKIGNTPFWIMELNRFNIGSNSTDLGTGAGLPIYSFELSDTYRANFFNCQVLGDGSVFLDNSITFPPNATIIFQNELNSIPAQNVTLYDFEFTTDALVYYKGQAETSITISPGDYCILRQIGFDSGLCVWSISITNKSVGSGGVTLTSQLTNDGADGVNPFITALDIPTTGQASTLVREVKNMTGATLTKGTVVYISGANGNKALVQKAIATTDALSARTFGLLQSDILNNGLGNCVIIGDLSGVNTSAFAEGAQLYLSGTVAGAFTDVRALAPTHLVYVGKVTRVHPTQGQIEVQIANGYELAEIHDVQIVTPLNNQALVYETSSELWKNKTIIEDSIVNGVTDKAPSQNAVFDALDLTRRLITNGTGSVTGTTAETILTSLTIPANTLDSKCFIWTTMDYFKTNTGSCTLRLYINTTNSVSGATLIGFVTIGSNRNVSFNRKLYLNGTTLDFLNSNTGATQISNEFVESLFGASTTLTVNPAANIFLIYTTQNDVVGTVATNKQATVQKLKLN